MSQRRSKTPLLLIMAGGICFAVGWRTVGLIISGVGVLLFAIGFGGSSEGASEDEGSGGGPSEDEN